MPQLQRGRRVCVIGAGIAGLVTAKVLAADGFEVSVFEKEAMLGGVWAPARTYPGLRANSARETYCFSDYPYPRSADPFPSAEQVRDYLRSYAERFGVLSKIEFRTEVIRVANDATTGLWQVTLRRPHRTEPEIRTFEFVVICNGVFSAPKLPEIPDLDRFKGQILHSSELANQGCLKGKRIVVVGAGKSAIDCAAWASHEAASSTFLYRRPQWMLPRFMFGLIKTEWIMRTRAMEALMPYYKLNRFERFLHGRAAFLVRAAESALFALVRLHLRSSPELLPDKSSLANAFESSGLVSDFYKRVRDGAIRAKRGAIEQVVDSCTLKLDTGELLPADVLIFATGWEQHIPFLDEDTRNRIQHDGRFHLYRTILPPDIPTLGLIGYNSSTSNQITSEVAAHWLAEVFLGRMQLPSVDDMNADVAQMHQWIEREMPAHRGGYFIGPFVLHHCDDLMRDMELSPRRTRNPFAEYLFPVWPSRYSTIATERRRRPIRNGPSTECADRSPHPP